MINIDIDNKKLQTDGENYWIAPNATIIGEVVLKTDASVWFNAVLRLIMNLYLLERAQMFKTVQ